MQSAVGFTGWLGPWREASQLPAEFESVICWARDQKANAYSSHEGFWSQGKWWIVRRGKACFYDVTHWMPMPDGPNAKLTCSEPARGASENTTKKEK